MIALQAQRLSHYRHHSYVMLATTSLMTPSLSWPAFTSRLNFADCPFGSLATGTTGTSFGPYFPTELTQALVPPQLTATTYSSSTSQLTSTNSQPSLYVQHVSVSPGGMTKLIIGLVVAITILILFFTIGLGSCCVIQKRRRRKNELIAAHKAASETSDERQNLQMYIGQKVELDDEQRRHEMEATDIRYELEGSDVIKEMPGEEMESEYGKQQSSGYEH